MALSPEVREEESLRIKIGEAKNLISSSGAPRDTCCRVTLDQECIFSTAIFEKSNSPFYGEELQCQIPKRFRNLAFYILERSGNKEKIMGKVSLRREELHSFRGHDHWFPLRPVDVDSEVQGQVHLEVKFANSGPNGSPLSGRSRQRMEVRILECKDLSMNTSSTCNPYAAIAINRGRTSKRSDETKRTNVKKKTTNPIYDETFLFYIEKKGQNHERMSDSMESLANIELSVSLWHDDSRMARDLIGGYFPGVFLGEVKIPVKDLDVNTIHKAWYFLQPRRESRQSPNEIGSLRLNITYFEDHIFDAVKYDDLLKCLLSSSSKHPITSSPVYLLGELVEQKEVAAKPLVSIFFHEQAYLIDLITSLTAAEIEETTDPNTVFRGTTLMSKFVDELMKLVGQHYLQGTLKKTIDRIYEERKTCEIDPAKIKDGENIENNLVNLEGYVAEIFSSIVYSGLNCPLVMCEVFAVLRDAVLKGYPGINEVRYQAVSGFIFLRFFAPAILSPKMFHLRNDMPDVQTFRTLRLVSKAIQSLGNIGSAKVKVYGYKEDYMIPIVEKFSSHQHVLLVKNFLDVISSLTRKHSFSIEDPIILKEGYLTKKSQSKSCFGRNNFKRKFFTLTNESLMISHSKGSLTQYEIPITDILAVEDLEEESFTRKYMFQVIRPVTVLYLQASHCVEEREWKDILNKVSNMNRNRLKVYHPAAFLKGHWLCCKATEPLVPGCTPVTASLPPDIKMEVDTSRELERIHSILVKEKDKLQSIQEMAEELMQCEVIDNHVKINGNHVLSEDDEKETETVEQNQNNNECEEPMTNAAKQRHHSATRLLEIMITLEQEHIKYCKDRDGKAVLGSQEFPFGDDVHSTMVTGQ